MSEVCQRVFICCSGATPPGNCSNPLRSITCLVFHTPRAIQNYKEPAMMEMLDPEESAVPALNTQGSTASTAAAATAVPPPRPQSPAAADVGKQHGASGTGTTTTSSSGKADQRLVAVGRQGQHVGHGEQGAGPSAGCREQEGSLQHQQQRGRQRHRRRQGSRQQQDGAGIPQGRPGWAGLGPHVSGGTGGDGCSSSGVDGSTTVELPSIHALYSSLDYAGPPAPSPVHAAQAARAVRTAESGELQQQQQQQLWRHRDQEQVEPHSTRRLAQQKQPQQRHADLVQ